MSEYIAKQKTPAFFTLECLSNKLTLVRISLFKHEDIASFVIIFLHSPNLHVWS